MFCPRGLNRTFSILPYPYAYGVCLAYEKTMVKGVAEGVVEASNCCWVNRSYG